MILADKIIEERKKLGLSQEELAEKLNVSRQAVSKWEGAQSIPDLQKIIMMSELFSVSTDYLLKDEMELENKITSEYEKDHVARRVDLEEANTFMSTMEEQSKIVSLGIFLCILCPVLLIFLSGLVEDNIAGITETTASVIGLAVLFIMIAIAVFLFIQSRAKTERFDYLENEIFETSYGVTGLVREKKTAFKARYTRGLSVGVLLCILSPLPLIVMAIISKKGVHIISMVALLLCIAAVGVYMIVRVAIIKSSYEMLLQEGDYGVAKKRKSSVINAVSAIYWGIVIAVYLTWSFISNKWDSTWIVWPIAGVLCAPVIKITELLTKPKNNDSENIY